MPALDGMRAVSLAVNVPGPTAAARLVALGASVTKVEPPAAIRSPPPILPGTTSSARDSGS